MNAKKFGNALSYMIVGAIAISVSFIIIAIGFKIGFWIGLIRGGNI
ncbi:hypothetical protein [Companilactobacillus sp. DQM5]